ncbi:TetR/AcrR family transcriptional regulator [Luteococcus sp. H138]|uniref:TetR/AcrR family transcriptional regulator n=1 Tax=unclassified Luteococcus TaxID=2639923 RepID=UPI00313A7782
MPRIVDHAARRREIVYALWMVIHQQGIATASLRTVAAEAQISIGRIQHYFPSKDALVHEGCRELVTTAEAQHLNTDTGDALADLTALAVHTIPTTQISKVAATVWCAYVAHVGADPTIAELVREATEGGHTEMIRRCARARGHSSPTPDDMADGLELSALGDGLMMCVLAGAIRHEEAVDVIHRHIASRSPAKSSA